MRIWTLIAIAGLTLSSSMAAAAHAEFDGSFSEVDVEGDACQGIFAVRDYHTKHFLVGPTYRTSVLHFTDAESVGFFDGLSLIGRYGYNSDVFYEKDVTNGDWSYRVAAEGLLDRNVTVIYFLVAGTGPGGDTCTASATYSGFN